MVTRSCVLFLLLTLLSFVGVDQVNAQGAVSADELYREGQYQKALLLYESELRTEGASAALYYNMASCYARLDSLAPAVLYYRRALTLDPWLEDARYNLRVVESKTEDALVDGRPWFVLQVDKWVYSLSGWTWIVLGMVTFAIAVYLFVQFILRRRAKDRKKAFFSMLLFLAISVCCTLSMVHIAYYQQIAERNWVVMTSILEVKEENRVDSSTLFVLHAGAVVSRLQESEGWTELSLPDGRSGWVETMALACVGEE